MPIIKRTFDEEMFVYDFDTNKYWCTKCNQSVGKHSRHQHEMTKKHWEGLIEYYDSIMLPETI